MLGSSATLTASLSLGIHYPTCDLNLLPPVPELKDREALLVAPRLRACVCPGQWAPPACRGLPCARAQSPHSPGDAAAWCLVEGWWLWSGGWPFSAQTFSSQGHRKSDQQGQRSGQKAPVGAPGSRCTRSSKGAGSGRGAQGRGLAACPGARRGVQSEKWPHPQLPGVFRWASRGFPCQAWRLSVGRDTPTPTPGTRLGAGPEFPPPPAPELPPGLSSS